MTNGRSNIGRYGAIRLSRAGFIALLRCDSGAALVEYAVISFILGLLMITTMVAMQQSAGANLDGTQTALTGAAANP